MAENELWRETLKRSRERFVAFADLPSIHGAPPVSLVAIRCNRTGDDGDLQRTLRFLEERFDPEDGLLKARIGNGTAGKLMFRTGCSQISMCDTTRSQLLLFNSFRASRIPEELRSRFIRLARESATAVVDAGIADELFPRIVGAISREWADGLWLVWLLQAAWKGVGGTQLTASRMTVNPTGSRAVPWSHEAWQQERAMNRDIHEGKSAGDRFFASAKTIPDSEWPDKLPTCWFSILMDVPNRSVELIDWILSGGSCNAEAPEETPESSEHTEAAGSSTRAVFGWPPDDGWHFRPGEVWFRKVMRDGLDKHGWLILKRLAGATRPLTRDDLWDEVDPTNESNRTDGAMNQKLSALRKWLRNSFRIEGDPIPSVRGHGVYRFNSEIFD